MALGIKAGRLPVRAHAPASLRRKRVSSKGTLLLLRQSVASTLRRSLLLLSATRLPDSGRLSLDAKSPRLHGTCSKSRTVDCADAVRLDFLAQREMSARSRSLSIRSVGVGHASLLGTGMQYC